MTTVKNLLFKLKRMKVLLYSSIIVILLIGLLLPVACVSDAEINMPVGEVLYTDAFYQEAPDEEPVSTEGKALFTYNYDDAWAKDVPGPHEGWPEGYQKYLVYAKVKNTGGDGSCVFTVTVEGNVKGDDQVPKSVYLKKNTEATIAYWWYIKGQATYSIVAVNIDVTI